MPLPFQVLILGSGSAIPEKGKNHSAQLVIYNSKYFLIDCGEGTQISLRKYNISIQKIDHIFISHLHGDHYLGLAGLIFSMNLLGREKKLIVYGPEGLKTLIDLHFELAKSRCSFELVFVITNSKDVNELLKEDDVSVTSFPVKHKIPTTGFVIKAGSDRRKLISEEIERHNVPKHLRAGIAKGRDFKSESGEVISNQQLTLNPLPYRIYAYCADALFRLKITEYFKNADLVYHEASFLKADEKKAKEVMHSTAEQAAKLAKESNCKKLLIGHFSNKYKDDEAFLKEARLIFKETYKAEEGKYYEIN